MSDSITKILVSVFELCLAGGLVNVWLLRFHKQTNYRGGNAKNMKEEFASYGLPAWAVYVVGFLKLCIAGTLIVVFLSPQHMYPFGVAALLVLGVLMLGAIRMHMRVHDRAIKMLPATLMLLMTLATLYLVM